jgi:hypothetical protein
MKRIMFLFTLAAVLCLGPSTFAHAKSAKPTTEGAAVHPISPDEVVKYRAKTFPKEVIEVINTMISEAWNGYMAELEQDEVLTRICQKLKISSDEALRRHLLDFEEVYRDAGWNVEYDRPGYDESYEANYKFTRPKK